MTAPLEIDIDLATALVDKRGGGTIRIDPEGGVCVFQYPSAIRSLRFDTRWRNGVQTTVEHAEHETVAPENFHASSQAGGSHRATIKVAANDNLPLINPADWHGLPVPAREWFLDGLIPRRQVTILNGDGGVGKSLLALQIASASALGCETLGLQPLAGRVMYLGAEDEADEFHRRLADITHGLQRGFSDLADFRLVPMAGRDALLAVPDKAGVMQPTDNMLNLVASLNEFRPGFLVLDTSADLFGGDEIKRNHVRQFIGLLRKQAIELDMAVLLLSHPSVAGMQTGTGSSGSTAWSNSVRSRLYLTAATGDGVDPNARVLTTMKANYGKKGGEIRVCWHEGVFVLDDGKPSIIAGVLSKRADETFKKLLSTFNRTGQTLSDVTGTNYAPAKMAKHADANGVSKRQFADAMQRLLESDAIRIVKDGPPSRQRKRLILASEDYGGT
ncbi:AAA family ATPase [Mesorhizobium caraganae]|uniref:AAA family ATPase n=1 Tax=Mesorhizobium caraganae TaxID=483206 RepID=UPI00193A8B25|nr:AAA family ATPase [Mesorhizobium caraganae]MBM2715471.1 AAA family ATPase [Mesorhizobium caraganae]